jgi:hypothetical protein
MTVRPVVLLVLVLAAASCGRSSNSSRTSPGDDTTFSPPAATLFTGSVGSSFTQSISVASGGTQPFVFTLRRGPPGLALAQVDSFSATLSGTPTAAGLSVVEIGVVDALNKTAFVSYQFQTNAGAGPALAITPTTIPPAVKPQTYTQFFSVTTGVAPFTWSLAGSLPPNLVFHPTTGQSCDISGVPVLAGSFAFTLSVSDSSSPPRAGSATITLVVQ